MYCELVKYGNLLEMHVCDNVGDHLIGNVYARYDWEDEAASAVDALNKRWYAGKLISVFDPFEFRLTSVSRTSTHRSTTIRRVVSRDGFPRGVLSTKRSRQLRPWRFLQLHALEAPFEKATEGAATAAEEGEEGEPRVSRPLLSLSGF